MAVAVVYEASADLQTATDLADRVLMSAIEWLEPELLDHQRTWPYDHAGSRFTWKGIKQLAANSNIRAVGSSTETRPSRTRKQPGERSDSFASSFRKSMA